MLQLILHIFIVSVICMLWGTPVLLLYKKNNAAANFWFRSTTGLLGFLFFSGIITLSFISSCLCLLIPLKFSYLILLTAGLSIYLFVKRKEIEACFRSLSLQIKLDSLDYIFLSICVITFLVAGSLKPVNGDTQIYHVQITRWFNEYGAVPGIANLFPRFGLGSNWFNLISFFYIPVFKNQNFTYLNTAAVIWYFLWLFNNWKFHSAQRNNSAASKVMSHFYFLVILFCFFEWELFRDAANSTNYDFIVTALTITAISFLFESILFPSELKTPSFIFIVLCLSVIPFKLSGVFLSLLLLFYLFGFKKIKYFFFTFLTGAIIIFPFLVKNYIVTGYPLYPLSFNIGTPDWQVPVAMTDYLRQYIHVTNRFYNSYTLNFTNIPELMNKSWLNHWFNGILVQQKIIILTTSLSLALFFLKTNLSINYKKLRVFTAILFLMAACWFFTAPSPRFGYGVLIPLAFFPISFFIGSRIIVQLHKPVIILTLFITCYYLSKKSMPLIKDPEYLIYPVNLTQPPVKKITISGMEFYLPEIINNGWMRDCFNTPLPCTCQENKYLQPRGSSLKNGFKMNPLPDSIFIRNYVY